MSDKKNESPLPTYRELMGWWMDAVEQGVLHYVSEDGEDKLFQTFPFHNTWENAFARLVKLGLAKWVHNPDNEAAARQMIELQRDKLDDLFQEWEPPPADGTVEIFLRELVFLFLSDLAKSLRGLSDAKVQKALDAGRLVLSLSVQAYAGKPTSPTDANEKRIGRWQALSDADPQLLAIGREIGKIVH